jgi:hypothetical protein
VNQPETQGDRSHSQFHLRWWPAAVIVVLGVAAMLFAWFGMGFDRTFQVFSLWVLVPLTLLALADCLRI